MVHLTDPTFSLSFRIRVCHPNTRIYVRLLGPCFKTGRLKPFRQHPKRWCGSKPCSSASLKSACRLFASLRSDKFPKSAAVLSPTQTMTPGYNTTEVATFLKLFRPSQTDVDSHREEHRPKGRLLSKCNTGSKRFPFDNFTYYLTLFSKFFSSFPHGTCSLSVSRHYLALDGIYHPFWSAFPNKPTLGKRITWERLLSHGRDSHPLWCLVPKNLYSGRPRKRFSKLQFAVRKHWDFKFELFPLHSPLLGESLLVSFPPLIDMLKFSGSSYLIWDLSFSMTESDLIVESKDTATSLLPKEVGYPFISLVQDIIITEPRSYIFKARLSPLLRSQ